MRFFVRLGLGFLIASLSSVGFAGNDSPNETINKAQTLSSLTGSHAQPFHMLLRIAEPSNPNSPYQATVEEFWESPRSWQRVIVSKEFRQNISVKDKVETEQNNGGYYPLWLRRFVTAAIDPLEDSVFWSRVSARVVKTTNAAPSERSSCARAQFKIGTTAVNNDAFAVICFNSDGTLESVVRPDYSMEFHDLQPFGKKRIAHTYVDFLEPGTKLVGTVETLEPIEKGRPFPGMMEIENASSVPAASSKIGQDSFEGLAQHSVMVWPPVQSGNTSGKLSMYVSVDRDGKVREAYPLNSDNAGLQAAARDQLLKWRLKPAANQGVPVQVESGLTFEFTTVQEGAIGAPAPQNSSEAPAMKPIVVSPAVVSSMLTKSYAPVYPQALKIARISGKVEMDAVIGRNGQIVSLTPKYSTDPEFTKAAITAVQHWAYKPYLLNGSPVEVQTVITVKFNVQ